MAPETASPVLLTTRAFCKAMGVSSASWYRLAMPSRLAGHGIRPRYVGTHARWLASDLPRAARALPKVPAMDGRASP